VDSDAIAALRAHYADVGLDEAQLPASPMPLFDRWLAEVVALGVPEPNAMVVSTVDVSADGVQPSSRHVLLKGVRESGFVFYTNYGSRKGRELAETPRAALCFPWFCIGRQVSVRGVVTKITREETEAYFATRPRESQLGAWASAHQSDVVPTRAWLDEQFALVERRFAEVADIPAPPFWGGFLVQPLTVEFWQGRAARMHDRLRYRRDRVGPDAAAAGAGWVIERLSP
jgi:pyridoxamine 5'-phosphate oxidase